MTAGAAAHLQPLRLLLDGGFFASLRVLRHRLEPRGLRVHYGAFADGFVSYQAIDHFSFERRGSPRGRDRLRILLEISSAYLAAGGRTDLTIELREPLGLNGLMNPTIRVATIYLATDELERLRRELRRRGGRHERAARLSIESLCRIWFGMRRPSAFARGNGV